MSSRQRLATIAASTLASVALCGPTAVGSPLITKPSSPLATTEWGAATSAVGAVVQVAINSLGLPTHYDVQYGTGTGYGSTTSVTTASAGTGDASYSVPLTDLTPSKVYHYRVAATNLFGTTYGDDATFATWPEQIPFHSNGLVSKNNVMSQPRNGRKPAGWVMVIHGGGWQAVGRAAVASEKTTVSFVSSLGWAADNVDYRKGEHSLPDVLAAYDALRRRIGRAVPVCLVGHSAGGNLALLVAEYRKSVDCVISEAGPTDLVDFPNETAYPSTTRYEGELVDPAWGFEHFMVTSFGVDPTVLRTWSPTQRAGSIGATVLLGASSHDALVPQQQMAELRAAMHSDRARGTIKTVLLAGAATADGETANFTHAGVTPSALAIWQRDERRVLARAATRRG